MPIQDTEQRDPFMPSKRLRRRDLRGIATSLGKQLTGRPVRSVPISTATAVPVLLIPGFMAGDLSMIPLARYLRRHGHPTLRTGIRFNVACTEDLLDLLERRLERYVAEAGRPVAVVGWSRGGSLARMLTVRRPDLVAGLITLASPLLDQLAAAPFVLKQVDQLVKINKSGKRRVLTEDCVHGECADRTHTLLRRRFPEHIPFTSVYTRADAIVDWRSCLDPEADLVEVSSTSHSDIGTSPAVYRIVAKKLAAYS